MSSASFTESTLDTADPALDVASPLAPVMAGAGPAAPSPPAPGPVPQHVGQHPVSGTSALGAGILLERGMGFTANILAARFGGIATFGAYSLAISTANNISTYAAGQIGSTAARFSGKYQHGTPGYGTLGRALAERRPSHICSAKKASPGFCDGRRFRRWASFCSSARAASLPGSGGSRRWCCSRWWWVWAWCRCCRSLPTCTRRCA